MSFYRILGGITVSALVHIIILIILWPFLGFKIAGIIALSSFLVDIALDIHRYNFGKIPYFDTLSEKIAEKINKF